MAEPEFTIDPAGDEEMAEDEVEEEEATDEPPGLQDTDSIVPDRTTFLDYLSSPIIELAVGPDPTSTILHVHQLLLTQSPFFVDTLAALPASPRKPHRIDLRHDDLAAASAVMEYLYKGDYFPAITDKALAQDPNIPRPDDAGLGLLRHARVYTLAQRFGLPQLSVLAHRKIHLTESTAKGEIAYARFVYAETSPDDQDIRHPVAAFWAQRSHVLRHEAEDEFKRMCLDYPQFGFDVLNRVLDQQEKRSQRQDAQSSGGAGRKRQRVSGIMV